MRWDDLTDDGWLKVVGKGDLPAKIPLHATVARALAGAREQRTVECSWCGHEAASPWVFPARTGDGHVNPTTVWTWVASVAKEAGIENMTTHRLRHTCLATALDATGDLRAVRDFARHASVETTQGYTRTTEQRLRAVLGAINYGASGDE